MYTLYYRYSQNAMPYTVRGAMPVPRLAFFVHPETEDKNNLNGDGLGIGLGIHLQVNV